MNQNYKSYWCCNPNCISSYPSLQKITTDLQHK